MSVFPTSACRLFDELRRSRVQMCRLPDECSAVGKRNGIFFPIFQSGCLYKCSREGPGGAGPWTGSVHRRLQVSCQATQACAHSVPMAGCGDWPTVLWPRFCPIRRADRTLCFLHKDTCDKSRSNHSGQFLKFCPFQ